MKPTMTKRDAEERAVHDNRIEGIVMTDRHRAMREKVVAGEMSEAEFRDRIVREFKDG